MLLIHVVAAGLGTFLLLDGLRERSAVATWVRGVSTPSAQPLQQVLSLADAIHTSLPVGDDPPFLLEILSPLGGAPTAIIARGGCCSGRARLLILGCGSLGHFAAQVAIYHRSGQARHCIAEVVLPEGPVLVDPMYGLYYRSPGGGLLGLDGLRQGLRPVLLTLSTHAPTAYPPDGYYDFDYSDSRTLNWTKSLLRRWTYRLAYPFTVGRIDTMRLPMWLEYPHGLLAVLLFLPYFVWLAIG